MSALYRRFADQMFAGELERGGPDAAGVSANLGSRWTLWALRDTYTFDRGHSNWGTDLAPHVIGPEVYVDYSLWALRFERNAQFVDQSPDADQGAAMFYPIPPGAEESWLGGFVNLPGGGLAPVGATVVALVFARRVVTTFTAPATYTYGPLEPMVYLDGETFPGLPAVTLGGAIEFYSPGDPDPFGGTVQRPFARLGG